MWKKELKYYKVIYNTDFFKTEIYFGTHSTLEDVCACESKVVQLIYREVNSEYQFSGVKLYEFTYVYITNHPTNPNIYEFKYSDVIEITEEEFNEAIQKSKGIYNLI